MNLSKNKSITPSLRVIFFVQIGLIFAILLLFFIGYFDNGLDIGAFFFSIIAGAIGASISLMRNLQNQEHATHIGNSVTPMFSILMPVLYGTLMAGVAYLFFMSGLLSGDGGHGLLTTNLFPNFNGTTVFNENILDQFVALKPNSMQDTGKLLVWCFLAGYSERFVTGILHQLEQKGVH